MTLPPLDAPLHAWSGLDITAPDFKANPFPYYARLREEAPVFPVTLRLRGERRAWLVTRYDDVLSVLKDDTRLIKEPRRAMTPEQWRKAPKMPAVFSALNRNLLSLDGTDHDRLKVLVHQAFTPRRVETMREQTQVVIDASLDRTERLGRFDLIREFALPVPLTIISRILGVPDHDLPRFEGWMKAFLAVAGSPNPLLIVQIMSFMRYLRGLISARRKKPQDDLISALVEAQEGNDHLTDDEVLAMIFLLLSAGHETTVNLIASGTLALLQHPDQWDRLRAAPTDAGLLKSGVEELVRYVVPAEMATERYATEDVTLSGITIPRGELVLAVLGSANRDGATFADPDRLDLGRTPNRHLSFGQGMHYCLGAPLSRLEAGMALSSLARRLPELRLAVPAADLRWRRGLILRGLESLPVVG